MAIRESRIILLKTWETPSPFSRTLEKSEEAEENLLVYSEPNKIWNKTELSIFSKFVFGTHVTTVKEAAKPWEFYVWLIGVTH